MERHRPVRMHESWRYSQGHDSAQQPEILKEGGGAASTPQEKRIWRKYGSGDAMDRIFFPKNRAKETANPAPKTVSRM